MAPAGRSHRRAGGTVDKGRDYEHGLSALLLLRAIRRWPLAELSTNVSEAGKFDDIVLLPPAGEFPPLLIQMKHKHETFCVRDHLLNSDNKTFGIKTYFSSFCDLWGDEDLWRNLQLDKTSVKFVLYTNAEVSAKNGRPVDPDLVSLLGTGSPGRAFYLDASSHPCIDGNLRHEFLERFVIFSEQSNAENVQLLLQQEAARGCGLLPGLWTATHSFLKGVHETNLETGSVRFMNAETDCYKQFRRYMAKQTRLTDGLVFSDLAMRKHCNHIERKFTGHRIISVVIPNSSAQLRSCVAFQVLEMASLTPVFVVDAENVRDVLRLWQQTPSTLVLDEETLPLDTNFIDGLQSALLAVVSAERRLLLLSATHDGGLSKVLTTTPPLSLDISVADLHPDTRDALLKTEIRLRDGQRPIPLTQLASETLLSQFGTDDISVLLCPGEPIALAKHLPPPNPHYVQRQLRAMIPVSFNILKDPTIEDIFLVGGMSVNELKAKVHSPQHVREITRSRSLDVIGQYAVCRDYTPVFVQKVCQYRKKPAHYLHCIDNQLYVKYSVGKVNNLLRHMEKKQKEAMVFHDELTISESALWSSGLSRMGLSSDPGMGKSTFLRESARRMQEMNPNWFVVVVSLNELHGQLSTFQNSGTDPRDAVQSLLCSASFESDEWSCLGKKLLLHALWQTGDCAVFVDAFDEIAPKYVSIAGDILSTLMQSPVKLLWVATRPVTRKAVQQALDVDFLTLEPLSYGQQNRLMLNIWKRNDMVAEKLAERTLKKLNHHRALDDIPLTGSPFVIQLLTQVTPEEGIDGVLNSLHEMSVFQLICTLVDKTFSNYLEKKMKLDLKHADSESLVQLIKQSFIRIHCNCGMLVIFSDSEKTVDFEDIMNVIESGREKGGLLVDVVFGQPRFVHRIFAEFFAAKWMANNWRTKRELLDRLITEHQLRVVREFFNDHLVDGFPLHQQILREETRRPKESFARQHLCRKDKAGRLPLHIAASVSDCRMVDYLCELGAKLGARDDLKNMTPLDYAVTEEAWTCCRVLINMGAYVENDVSDHPLIKDLFAAGLTVQWKAFQGNWPVLGLEAINQFLHDAAVLTGHEECLTWLLHVFPINSVDFLFKTRKRGLAYMAGCLERNAGSQEDEAELKKKIICAMVDGDFQGLEYLLGCGAPIDTSDTEGNTPLHYASRTGKTAVASTLIRRGAQATAVNQRGQTAKMVAIEAEKTDIVTLFDNIDQGEPTESVFRLGLQLVEAAAAGELKTVHQLLLRGADTAVAWYPSGWTALHNAAWHGHTETVRLLCSSGVDFEIQDANDRRPLHIAAQFGHVDIVRFLIASGAYVHAEDVSRNVPVDLAVVEGNIDVVKILLQEELALDNMNIYQSLKRAACNGHFEVIFLLLDSGAEIDRAEKCKILDAALKQNTQAALSLIKKNPFLLEENFYLHGRVTYYGLTGREMWRILKDATERDDMKINILDFMEGVVRGDCQYVKNLLDDQVNACVPLEYFQRALLVAAGSGQYEVCQLLLEAGFSEERHSMSHDTVLHFASAQGHLKVVKLLMERGGNINAKNKHGHTPLLLAIDQGHEAVAEALMEAGAIIEGWTISPEELLHFTAHKGLTRIVELLLESSINCNALEYKEPERDSWQENSSEEPRGITALHHAAAKGHTKIISVLLNKGAKVNIRDGKGQTALHYAYKYNNKEAASLLIAHGADETIRDCKGRNPVDLTLQF